MEVDQRLTPSTQLGGISNLALLAVVKPGLIPGAETYTYAQRLQGLLGALHAAGLALRESTLAPQNVFPDSVGRWDLIQSFRYAVIPPRLMGDSVTKSSGVPTAGTYHLYLNVAFDAGWETYIRVIYRDLGPLLDTIFSNCEGYKSSAAHGFEEYVSWVRSREVPSGLLYTESSSTVLDQR